jgi:hypothetical protein
VLSVLTALFALFALFSLFALTHNNTNLTAANINLNTTQDTKIKGANLQASLY